MYCIHRFNQNYGVLGILERLHGIDNVFSFLIFLNAKNIMITETNISKIVIQSNNRL